VYSSDTFFCVCLFTCCELLVSKVIVILYSSRSKVSVRVFSY
jgi:hypothetical protein